MMRKVAAQRTTPSPLNAPMCTARKQKMLLTTFWKLIFHSVKKSDMNITAKEQVGAVLSVSVGNGDL